jgi:hypothetical protein
VSINYGTIDERRGEERREIKVVPKTQSSQRGRGRRRRKRDVPAAEVCSLSLPFPSLL